MPRSVASYLGLHCLSMSHKMDARGIWVKQQQNLGEDAFESSCGLGCEYVLVCAGFLRLFSLCDHCPVNAKSENNDLMTSRRRWSFPVYQSFC